MAVIRKTILSVFIQAVLFLSIGGRTYAQDLGEAKTLFETIPDISFAMRINNLQDFGMKFDHMLSQVSPGWTLPGAILRPIAAYLKTPDFTAIQENAFMEFMLFKSAKSDEHFMVCAFPVEDPVLFMRQVETYGTMTSNALGGGITHLKQQHVENSDFYVGVLHNNIVVYCSNQATLEYAYELYNRLPRGALPSGSRNDMDVFLHCKRTLISYASMLDLITSNLEEDIANDLSINSTQNSKTSLKRMVNQVISELRIIANQFTMARFSFNFENSQFELGSSFEIEDDSISIMSKDTPLINPQLVKYLPERTVSFAWKSVSPVGFKMVSSRVSSLLAFLLDGAVDTETTDDLENFRSKILAMRPVEAVTATVKSAIDPSNKELSLYGSISPGRVAIVRLENPSAFRNFINGISYILGPRSSFVEQLERNGISVTYSQTDLSGKVRGVELHRVDIGFTQKRDESSTESSDLNFSGNYYMALNGNMLLVAVGPASEQDINDLINSTRGDRSFSKSHLGRNTTTIIGRNRFSSVFMIDPLAYIQVAAMAYAKYGQAYSVGGKPHKTVDFARQYNEIKNVALPLLLTFSHTESSTDNLSFIPDIHSRFSVPYSTARTVIRAVFEPDTE